MTGNLRYLPNSPTHDRGVRGETDESCNKYGGIALAIVLIAVGIFFVSESYSAGQFVSNHFAAGGFASGVVAAGEFSADIFTAGTFAIRVFSAGIFSVGVFSIGLFPIGLFGFGVFLVARDKKNRPDSE